MKKKHRFRSSSRLPEPQDIFSFGSLSSETDSVIQALAAKLQKQFNGTPDMQMFTLEGNSSGGIHFQPPTQEMIDRRTTYAREKEKAGIPFWDAYIRFNQDVHDFAQGLPEYIALVRASEDYYCFNLRHATRYLYYQSAMAYHQRSQDSNDTQWKTPIRNSLVFQLEEPLLYRDRKIKALYVHFYPSHGLEDFVRRTMHIILNHALLDNLLESNKRISDHWGIQIIDEDMDIPYSYIYEERWGDTFWATTVAVSCPYNRCKRQHIDESVRIPFERLCVECQRDTRYWMSWLRRGMGILLRDVPELRSAREYEMQNISYRERIPQRGTKKGKRVTRNSPYVQVMLNITEPEKLLLHQDHEPTGRTGWLGVYGEEDRDYHWRERARERRVYTSPRYRRLIARVQQGLSESAKGETYHLITDKNGHLAVEGYAVFKEGGRHYPYLKPELRKQQKHIHVIADQQDPTNQKGEEA